jgi:hypothetical protein
VVEGQIPAMPPHLFVKYQPFYLKGPWTAAKLGNPPKQVVLRDIMINPKTNLGLTRGW